MYHLRDYLQLTVLTATNHNVSFLKNRKNIWSSLFALCLPRLLGSTRLGVNRGEYQEIKCIWNPLVYMNLLQD